MKEMVGSSDVPDSCVRRKRALPRLPLLFQFRTRPNLFLRKIRYRQTSNCLSHSAQRFDLTANYLRNENLNTLFNASIADATNFKSKYLQTFQRVHIFLTVLESKFSSQKQNWFMREALLESGNVNADSDPQNISVH